MMAACGAGARRRHDSEFGLIITNRSATGEPQEMLRNAAAEARGAVVNNWR